jgi:AcrR family transcriptional regulator
MVKKTKTGPTADRYIETTVELIAEKGGSADVNLREISRRIGCAHTNAYNYFASREDLVWHALRNVLLQYGSAISRGLDDSLSPRTYFRRMFRNMVEWSVENPGLHRFISSDPMDPEEIPRDIIESVIELKNWFAKVLKVLAHDRAAGDDLERLVDVTLGYLDGEVFNLINGRVLPGEDIAGRVIDNLERVFTLLTARTHDGLTLSAERPDDGEFLFPTLEMWSSPSSGRSTAFGGGGSGSRRPRPRAKTKRRPKNVSRTRL